MTQTVGKQEIIMTEREWEELFGGHWRRYRLHYQQLDDQEYLLPRTVNQKLLKPESRGGGPQPSFTFYQTVSFLDIMAKMGVAERKRVSGLAGYPNQRYKRLMWAYRKNNKRRRKR